MEPSCTYKVIKTQVAMLVMVSITPNTKYELITPPPKQLLM